MKPLPGPGRPFTFPRVRVVSGEHTGKEGFVCWSGSKASVVLDEDRTPADYGSQGAETSFAWDALEEIQ